MLALHAVWLPGAAFAAVPQRDDTPRSSGSPKASPAMAREIKELSPLLESDDLAVRQATAARLIAMGEPALAVFEEEMRRQRLAPNGQVKLVLLKLRSLREDRLWEEAISALARSPRQSSYLIRKEGETLANVKVVVRPASKAEAADSLQVEIIVEPQRPVGAGKGATGGAGRVPMKAQHIKATLAKDRTLTPRRVEVMEEGRQRGEMRIAEHRLRGELDGRELDAAAPPPLALDWALPLVVEVMPRAAETELALTLVEAASGRTQGVLMLRCLGERRGQQGSKEQVISAYELQPAVVGGPAAFGRRLLEVGPEGRLLRAELGDGSVLEAPRTR